MKRLFSIALILILVGSVALAESIDWTIMTDEELHGAIDAARNELSKRELSLSENTILVDQDGIQLYLTGEHTFSDWDETKYVELGVVLVNDSDQNISVSIENLYVNGWNVYAMCGATANSGKRDKSTIDMNVAEAEVNTFEEIQDMEFSIRLYNSDSFDRILETDSITIHFN